MNPSTEPAGSCMAELLGVLAHRGAGAGRRRAPASAGSPGPAWRRRRRLETTSLDPAIRPGWKEGFSPGIERCGRGELLPRSKPRLYNGVKHRPHSLAVVRSKGDQGWKACSVSAPETVGVLSRVPLHSAPPSSYDTRGSRAHPAPTTCAVS